jgi:hypothetical protein
MMLTMRERFPNDIWTGPPGSSRPRSGQQALALDPGLMHPDHIRRKPSVWTISAQESRSGPSCRRFAVVAYLNDGRWATRKWLHRRGIEGSALGT